MAGRDSEAESPVAHNLSRVEPLVGPAAGVVCDQPDGPNNDSVSANFYINYGTIADPVLTVADYRQALDDTFAIEVTSYGWAETAPLSFWLGDVPAAR